MLDKEFVSRMKVKLESMKREILESLAVEDEEFKELMETDEVRDFADIASDDISSKTLAILGQQELKRLRLIESALARIANGTYGHCLETRQTIPKERLEAVPYAKYCVDVQNEMDKKKRMGA